MLTRHTTFLVALSAWLFSANIGSTERNTTEGNSFPKYSTARPVMNPAQLEEIIQARSSARLVLGYTSQGREIIAWYFPGLLEERALVVGGIHGSELSSVAVAQSLIERLRQGAVSFYSVIIIPELFPDNTATAIRFPAQMGSVQNIGRYSYSTGVDPNRQMPSPGKAFRAEHATDHIGREIEVENREFLSVIQLFRPTRIAALHAIRNTNYGGIYADPRTDEAGLALGYTSDSSLAIQMAHFVRRQGANVQGNFSGKRPTALYYKDPRPVAAGQWQKRNMSGSSLKAHRGSGVSLGTWGTTAIKNEEDSRLNRDAMRVITMEFPGAKRPEDYPHPVQRIIVQRQVDAFAEAIEKIFLGTYLLDSTNPVMELPVSGDM